MNQGLTIADFVQKVFYAMHKVRLDTTYSVTPGAAFHADTDKYKEIVMEANFVLEELQQAMDWNWLRSRWNMGTTEVLDDNEIQEFHIPDDVYKVCTGFNDAVRLHDSNNVNIFYPVPFTSPRNGSVNNVTMFNTVGQINAYDPRLLAFVVGEHLTFNRPFTTSEAGLLIETDVVDLLEPLHICDSSCTQPCPSSYVEKVLTKIPDPYYVIVRTAAKRAEGDPSIAERVLSLTDEASKLLSGMRENDSAKTVPDTYQAAELGYLRVL